MFFWRVEYSKHRKGILTSGYSFGKTRNIINFKKNQCEFLSYCVISLLTNMLIFCIIHLIWKGYGIFHQLIEANLIE